MFQPSGLWLYGTKKKQKIYDTPLVLRLPILDIFPSIITFISTQNENVLCFMIKDVIHENWIIVQCTSQFTGHITDNIIVYYRRWSKIMICSETTFLT